MFPNGTPSGKRCPVSTANDLFIHSYLSEFPVKELSHETGRKLTVTAHGQEAYMQWGTTWFLKSILET
jgi:hypothetical protein